jgi:hypothetical protein
MLLMLGHADRAVNRVTTLHAQDPRRKPDDGIYLNTGDVCGWAMEKIIGDIDFRMRRRGREHTKKLFHFVKGETAANKERYRRATLGRWYIQHPVVALVLYQDAVFHNQKGVAHGVERFRHLYPTVDFNGPQDMPVNSWADADASDSSSALLELCFMIVSVTYLVLYCYV